MNEQVASAGHWGSVLPDGLPQRDCRCHPPRAKKMGTYPQLRAFLAGAFHAAFTLGTVPSRARSYSDKGRAS